MDVNATIGEILENLCQSGGDYQRSLELLEALVDWVAGGGFLTEAAVTADEVILGAYWFCNNYHGGYTSDEYRLFCKMQPLVGASVREPAPASDAAAVYAAWEVALHESWYAEVCA